MPAASTAPVRVLVAEDEPAMLGLVARHLKNLGFSVVEASEGDVAWRLAQEHVPDLVILDVMMPGMSGWEVCRRIKSEASDGGRFSRTGVIMLTGIGENLNEMTSPLFSADAWLNKPFEFTELDERVQETLQRYGGKAAAQGEAERSTAGSGMAARKRSSTAKPSAKRAPVKKAAKKEAVAKEAPAKKAAAKKTSAKKAPVKKAAAKKTSAKKTSVKKAPARQAPAGKASARKAPAAKQTRG